MFGTTASAYHELITFSSAYRARSGETALGHVVDKRGRASSTCGRHAARLWHFKARNPDACASRKRYIYVLTLCSNTSFLEGFCYRHTIHPSAPHSSSQLSLTMARPSTTRHSSRSSPFPSQEERRLIVSKLPDDAKTLAIAPARIYQAPFGAREDGWAYTGLSGMLVFGRDRVVMHADRPLGAGPGTSFERRYWFRLVDTAAGKGVIWIHLIPAEFQYRFDKPFFHVFQGKVGISTSIMENFKWTHGCDHYLQSRMFGIRFEEDAHAEKFYRKVSDSHATSMSCF